MSASEGEKSAVSKISLAADLATRLAQKEIDQYLQDSLTREVQKAIEPQLARISSAGIDELAAKISFPVGMVAAFERPGGCPEGWSGVDEQWRGRSFVSAVDNPYDAYGFGKLGGAAGHSLSIAEMPSHRHGISTFRGGGANIHDGLGGSTASYDIDQVFEDPIGASSSGFGVLPRLLEEVGDGEPHNNVPPYIALYFCKKN